LKIELIHTVVQVYVRLKCQLRFGGKRELATEMDSRVCILCLKLEAIFMHGLKKKPLLNSPTSQSSILSGTLQLNSIINLKLELFLFHFISIQYYLFESKIIIKFNLNENSYFFSDKKQEI